MTTTLTVLVTGATGFVGRRLVPALVEQRAPGQGDDPPPRRLRRSRGAGLRRRVRPGHARPAMEGVDVAVYLVHSLDDDDFERKDAEAARAFGVAAAASGVARSSTWAASAPRTRRSRRTCARAARSRSCSARRRTGDRAARRDRGRRRRHLVGDDPPAGQEPARDGGAAVGGHPDPADRPRRRDPLPRRRGRRREDLRPGLRDRRRRPAHLRRDAPAGGAEMHGRRVPIVQARSLTPRLSSHWIGLVTDVDTTTASNLIDSMSTEVLLTDTRSGHRARGADDLPRRGAPGARGGLRLRPRRPAGARAASSATRCSG